MAIVNVKPEDALLSVSVEVANDELLEGGPIGIEGLLAVLRGTLHGRLAFLTCETENGHRWTDAPPPRLCMACGTTEG